IGQSDGEELKPLLPRKLIGIRGISWHWRDHTPTGRGYLVIITASCQKLKNPFPDCPDYQPNGAPKRPNATVNKFRILSGGSDPPKDPPEWARDGRVRS